MNDESTIKSFDCSMICTLLGLTLDRKTMKKLAKKHGLVPAETRVDPNFNFYGLHHACHSEKNAPLRKELENIFNQRYLKMKRKLEEYEGSDPVKLSRHCRQLVEEYPPGGIWALLSSPKEEITKEGVYHVHRILLRSFELFREVKFEEVQVIEDSPQINHARETELSNISTKLTESNRKISSLEQKIQELEKENLQLKNEVHNFQERPDENRKLKREIRKLRYELEKTENGPEPVLFPESNRNEKPEREKADQLQMVSLERENCDRADHECQLEKMKVAVVGGLDRLTSRYRNVVEEMGGEFFFHNGNCHGVKSQILANTVCKADIVIFITSINSHNALEVTKATCKKSGCTLNILRSSSPSALKNLLCEKVALVDEGN